MTPRLTSSSTSPHSSPTTLVAGALRVISLPRLSVTVTGPPAAEAEVSGAAAFSVVPQAPSVSAATTAMRAVKRVRVMTDFLCCGWGCSDQGADLVPPDRAGGDQSAERIGGHLDADPVGLGE